jgi:hypothetical protein
MRGQQHKKAYSRTRIRRVPGKPQEARRPLVLAQPAAPDRHWAIFHREHPKECTADGLSPASEEVVLTRHEADLQNVELPQARSSISTASAGADLHPS